MDLFNDLCTPAIVYVVFTAFSLIGMIFGAQYGPAAAKFIFAFIYTYFLNWLCSKGYPGVSWFLVLLPFIFIGVAFLFAIFVFSQVAVVQTDNSTAKQNDTASAPKQN
jgi:predicted PurR-regulated permease PerM